MSADAERVRAALQRIAALEAENERKEVLLAAHRAEYLDSCRQHEDATDDEAQESLADFETEHLDAALASRVPQPDEESVSAWLIERPSDEPGRPRYWITAPGLPGIGEWTQDPWQATRYTTKEDGEREVRRWAVHPIVLDGVAVVSHGFIVPQPYQETQ